MLVSLPSRRTVVGALWLAGRWYASRPADSLATLLPLVVAAALGGLACELISSGAFYFPSDLGSLAIWVGVAALLHGTASALRSAALGSRVGR